MAQVDEVAARYADLLTGSYDCVDRVVLNAYCPLGHNPGGFRTWWRRWHQDGDESLDNAHLIRLAAHGDVQVVVVAAGHVAGVVHSSSAVGAPAFGVAGG